MDCCYSDYGSIVADMSGRAGPVDATYGWNNSVGVTAAWKAGEFAFDRLLGANRAAPLESYPQRPFDADAVFDEMQNRGLDKGDASGNGCRLVSTTAASLLLAPAIYNMQMSERLQESPQRGKSKLTLNGNFGTDQGTVKIGGVEVPITTWARDKVECEPADGPGPGFAGDVIVYSHDRPSNAVPLTQWHGQLTYAIDVLPPQVSNARAEITCDVYFRGDIHRFRNQAGQGLNSPAAFDFRAAPGSTAKWKVNGDPLPMTVWSAPTSADLPFGLNGTVDLPYGTGFIVSGNLDVYGGKAALSFNYLGCFTAYALVGAPGGGSVATLHDPVLTSTALGIGSDGYVTYANNLSATVDSDTFVVNERSLVGTTPLYEPKLTWTAFAPTFMPDRNKGEDDGH